ncbi:MAG TPA: hypothetical protein VN811_08535 [Thermoanaerobaculia bacterium]|nr:hypothetical protein [Thermoanaerobaculia bacterium]
MTTKKRKAAKRPARKASKGKSKRAAKRAAAPAAKAAAPRSPRGAMAVAASPKRSAEERVAAMAQASSTVCESDENLQKLLGVLRDQAEPIQVRLAALHALQAAAFAVASFEPCRGDYVAALREVATDPNAELRQRALGTLASDKDGFAQKKLLEGLRKPEMALVPPEKALQLLAYDAHADAYKAAREVLAAPPNPEAKREALRLLSADANSAPMLEKVLLDKSEDRENRQIAAAGLHALKPDRMQARARDILLDAGEFAEIQSTSLTALTQFGDEEKLADDQPLLARVDALKGEGAAKVKQSARKFLDRYVR